jgi:hypothetical protein
MAETSSITSPDPGRLPGATMVHALPFLGNHIEAATAAPRWAPLAHPAKAIVFHVSILLHANFHIRDKLRRLPSPQREALNCIVPREARSPHALRRIAPV